MRKGKKILVRTLTGAPVLAEGVAVGAATGVATGRVVADADTEVVVLELLALVDVFAGTVVGPEGKAVLACAAIAAPGVVALVLALTGVGLAFVPVAAATGLGVVFEPRLASALIRARGVDTPAGTWRPAQPTRQHSGALIYVHAFVVTADLVTF